MERIRQGRKTLTSRTSIHYPDEDVENYLEHPLPLWFIKKYLYRDEGADSPEELQRVINQIFRRKVDENRLFFVHILNKQAVVRKALKAGTSKE